MDGHSALGLEPLRILPGLCGALTVGFCIGFSFTCRAERSPARSFYERLGHSRSILHRPFVSWAATTLPSGCVLANHSGSEGFLSAQPIKADDDCDHAFESAPSILQAVRASDFLTHAGMLRLHGSARVRAVIPLSITGP